MDMFSGTCFLAVGLLVASVPVVRVVRVFAMGHEEMKVASGETHRAKRHDADIGCLVSISVCPENHDPQVATMSESLNLICSKCSPAAAQRPPAAASHPPSRSTGMSRPRNKTIPYLPPYARDVHTECSLGCE